MQRTTHLVTVGGVEELQMLLSGQDQVVSRRQALSAGLSRAAIEWKLARGDWVTLYPGVYAAQTGRLSTTAAKVARILGRRGWAGEFERCPECPKQDCG